MKKALSLILALVLCLGLCACDSGKTDDTTESTEATETKADTVATVINNNGDTEQVTAAELCKLKDANGVAFENKYFGAQVTLIGTVKSVSGSSIVNGHSMAARVTLEGGWDVEATTGKEVENLMPGDQVKVTGRIYNAFGSVSLYNINDWTTTIEPYNG